MSTSQIFGAIDALLAICQSVMPPTVTVFDGPSAMQPTTDYLVVGCDDIMSPASVGVDAVSDWAGLGALHRDEIFTIHCTYVAWQSDPTQQTARDRAAANVGLIENALRTTTGGILNGAINQPGWVGLQITKLQPVNTGNGVQLHTLFGVVCRGRI